MNALARSLAILLFLLYAGSYALRLGGHASAGFLDTFAEALELSLDALAVWLAIELLPRMRWVAGSFVATALASANMWVLGHVFGFELARARGSWLEIEVNVAYFAFFAMGALGLMGLNERLRGRAPWLWLLAGEAVVVAALGFRLAPDFMALGFPRQTVGVHVLAALLELLLLSTAVAGLVGARTSARFTLALGYASLAASTMLFQATVLAHGAWGLDVPIDLTWTLGQFTAIAGLLMEPPNDA